MAAQALEQLPEPRDVTGITPDGFAGLIADAYEPVVMRGLAADWRIVRAASESPQAVAGYLRRFDTGKPLPLVVAPPETGGRLFYNDAFDGFNFRREDATLGDGVDRILTRSGDDPYAFFQCLLASRSLPAIAEELPNPLVPPKTEPGIWIGSQITVAAHFDEARNIAIVAAGRRRFTLFPPEQVHNLYVGRLDLTPAGQPISLVNPREPDFDRHPRFREALAHALSVELVPGDAVYIPAPWWHHVESLERFNVLVNYWWAGARTRSGLPFNALIHALQAFRHLPEPERRAWRALLDHYVFDANGDPAAHLAPNDPGILGAMTPQMAQHIHRWLAHQLGPPKPQSGRKEQ